jgi:hypothetical protein
MAIKLKRIDKSSNQLDPTASSFDERQRTLLLLDLGSLRLDLTGTSEGSVNLTHVDEL